MVRYLIVDLAIDVSAISACYQLRGLFAEAIGPLEETDAQRWILRWQRRYRLTGYLHEVPVIALHAALKRQGLIAGYVHE